MARTLVVSDLHLGSGGGQRRVAARRSARRAARRAGRGGSPGPARRHARVPPGPDARRSSSGRGPVLARARRAGTRGIGPSCSCPATTTTRSPRAGSPAASGPLGLEAALRIRRRRRSPRPPCARDAGPGARSCLVLSGLVARRRRLRDPRPLSRRAHDGADNRAARGRRQAAGSRSPAPATGTTRARPATTRRSSRRSTPGRTRRRRAGARPRPSTAAARRGAGTRCAPVTDGYRARLLGALFPVAVGALNAAGLGPLRSELSTAELRRAGLRAISEVVERLSIDARHVDLRSHPPCRHAGGRRGPARWVTPNGVRLLLTGSVDPQHDRSRRPRKAPTGRGRRWWSMTERRRQLLRLLADREPAELEPRPPAHDDGEDAAVVRRAEPQAVAVVVPSTTASPSARRALSRRPAGVKQTPLQRTPQPSSMLPLPPVSKVKRGFQS